MAIYKYLSTDRLDVLRDARIRFTQPDALNDPFELKPFFKTILNMEKFHDRIRKKMDIRAAVFEMYEQVPSEVRAMLTPDQFVQLVMGQLEENKDQFEVVLNNYIDAMAAEMPALSVKIRSLLNNNLGSRVGVLSLSEDPVNDLMWAHYASNHAGFVIVFDENNEFFHRERSSEDEFFHLRRVNYINRRLIFESMEDMGGCDDKILVSKLDAWAYEKEWRMLVPLINRAPEIDASEPIHLFPFPREAVVGVIFGCKSSAALRNEILSVLNDDSAFRDIRTEIEYVDLESWEIATKPYP